MQFTKARNSQSNSESETSSPSIHPSDTDYNEGRTTHLEKQFDKMLLEMKVSLLNAAIAVNREYFVSKIFRAIIFSR